MVTMELGFHQQDSGFMSGLTAGVESAMLLLVVFFVGTQSRFFTMPMELIYLRIVEQLAFS